VSIRRKSRFGAALGLSGALFLAALCSCVGPDLEPPFSGKDSTVPQSPAGTPTTAAAGSTASPSAAAGRSGNAEGASTPQVGSLGGTTGSTLGSAGKAGGPTTDAGVADEDAGPHP
jgi:hypothetical protein